jgi:stearoyl-CoA desaturase (delta-9 desaturase)
LLGFLGATSAQKGPIWWASHHRHHHRHSDTPEDVHSPIVSGIYYAHVGWVLSSQFVETRWELVKDLAKFKELVLLDKFYYIPPVILAVSTYLLGFALNFWFPQLGTNGLQMLTWGFFVSTVFLYHGTFCVNSVAHLHGTKRFVTTDESRNSFLVSLITLGEGWHNNHHRYPGSESQGMYWWEVDISHYIIKALSWLGLVWDIRHYPERLYKEAKELASGSLVSYSDQSSENSSVTTQATPVKL